MSKAHTLALVVLLTAISPARAETASSFWRYDHGLVQTSLWTEHFGGSSEYVEQQSLVGIELHNPQRWFAGTAWFKNSFDQPTWYFYGGREIPLWQLSHGISVRAKLTAGLLRGYDGDKRDNIPLNHLGIAPAILPTIGLRWKRLEGDLIVFGTAGMMFTGGLRF
ncbi:hypothetical protein [Halomonas sp. M20]|uniref:hypothetical protein n=1 Tax=Halomonas sp. M20 TaxID=2763264 RepID=UPI001D0A937F|nr:hypothetical protein [Halomonas sp. M20]